MTNRRNRRKRRIMPGRVGLRKVVPKILHRAMPKGLPRKVSKFVPRQMKNLRYQKKAGGLKWKGGTDGYGIPYGGVERDITPTTKVKLVASRDGVVASGEKRFRRHKLIAERELLTHRNRVRLVKMRKRKRRRKH